MKEITKAEFMEYVAYSSDRHHRNEKREEFKELSKTIQDIIESDKAVLPCHLTEAVFKEIYIDCLKKLQPNYIIDENSNEIISLISRDRYVIKNNDRKGLLVMGSVGCGKTLLMKGLSETYKLFKYYDPHYGGDRVFNFDIIPTYSLSLGFSKEKNGFSIFDKGIFQAGSVVKFLNYDLCIDDLGAEDIAAQFGNVVNVVGNVLQQRYDLKSLTFATTNLDTKHLKEFYGERVYSRMKEIFNFLYMKGNDRRN